MIGKQQVVLDLLQLLY